MAGQPRYTFGSIELMGGVGVIPAMIGMFALAEIMRSTGTAGPRQAPMLGPVFAGLGAAIARRWRNVIRGGATGTVIGALPGAGADIAAWVAYAIAKRRSKTPEKFGKGHDEGIIEAGAANNGALSGAWDPTLAFVMGGAILPMVVAWRVARAGKPLAGSAFPSPPSAEITRPLIGGSVLFGVGWGLVGLCPGPALASISYGGWPGLVFLAAMLAGMWATPPLRRVLDRRATGT